MNQMGMGSVAEAPVCDLFLISLYPLLINAIYPLPFP